MYLPEAYNIIDKTKIDRFIVENNFADLVTFHDGNLCSNKCPFLYDNVNNKIFGHFGNHNIQLLDIAASQEVLVIFSGPHSYISPQWYESTGMVPTWNFQTIQVRGKATIMDADGLHEILMKLSKRHESNLSPQWSMDKLDPDRLRVMLNKITGFEINITDIKFKEKMGQNRSRADQQSVIKALSAHGGATQLDVARLMSANLDH